MPCSLGSGFLFLLFLQVRHEQEDLELLSIHFNVELYQHLELFTGEHLKFGKAPAWRTQMRKFGEISDSFEKSFALRGFIWNFLAQKILPDCTVLEQRIKQFQRFAPLIEKIGRCPWRDLTVAQMAATMHMGKETFAKLFPAATGESPKDFFNQMRAGLQPENWRTQRTQSPKSQRNMAFQALFISRGSSSDILVSVPNSTRKIAEPDFWETACKCIMVSCGLCHHGR